MLVLNARLFTQFLLNPKSELLIPHTSIYKNKVKKNDRNPFFNLDINLLFLIFYALTEL